MIVKVNESCQYSSTRYYVFALLLLSIVFLNYSLIIRYTSQLQYFGLIGFKISLLMESLNKIPYLLNISPLFSKNELKTTKKLNKVTKQICNTTISCIIIGVLFINILYIENQYVPKQHKKVNKFLKKTKNFPIMPRIWLNNNEITSIVALGCESESIDQGRSYEDKNISISLCFFSRSLSYSGHGSVIYVNGGSYSMNINYSMFYNCVCSDRGGSIYYISPNSFLRMICANRCSCGTYGHFALLQASQMNQVEYLSVSNCSHSQSGYYPIYLYIGEQRSDNTNSSMNNAFQCSGIHISSAYSFTSSHCTFSNNKVSDSICIYLFYSIGTISMLYANIVHNNSPYSGVVYVYGEGSSKMMNCIFHYNQNTLFHVRSGSLEVSHSFIDHSGSFSTFTAVLTSTNNSFTNRITYQLQFFKSYYCNAQLPVPVPSPMRTVFEMQTPMRSIEETIKRTNPETLRLTYEITTDQTIRETHNETPYRSYAEYMCTNQMANWREISVIFSFVSYIQ